MFSSMTECDELADQIVIPTPPPQTLEEWQEHVGRSMPGQIRFVVNTVAMTLWQRASKQVQQ